ncbi:RluA family pseudouridine synthase [Salisaeta longa]|uniref:RluA family pseudouridine synthase n=1 Tax=Salisaeta longa TaxID=503170 RepID=UPI0003B4717D|nr:RluA family pseudouridine synthase [Salisaeta longa]
MSDAFDPTAYDAEVTRAGNVVEVTVPTEATPVRIDKYLTRFYPQASRTKIQRSIKQGHVKVNGADVKKSYPVEPGDQIVCRLIQPPPLSADPEAIPLDVVYEDEHLLVVHKPAGMVVHPAPGHRSGTLVNALLHHVDGASVAPDDEAAADDVGLSMVNALPARPNHPVVRPGIVHRLDKGTSGLLVVAKRDTVHRALAAQFKAHTIDRVYHAIVWGRPDPPAGTVSGAIGRDPNHRQRMAVVPPEDGKAATTHYETIGALTHVAHMRFQLETGRTHQIRVHARHMGHPVLGDPKYDGARVRYGTQSGSRRRFFTNLFETMPHPALHAHRLGFTHPATGEHLTFTADWPEDVAAVWARLQKAGE